MFMPSSISSYISDDVNYSKPYVHYRIKKLFRGHKIAKSNFRNATRRILFKDKLGSGCISKAQNGNCSLCYKSVQDKNGKCQPLSTKNEKFQNCDFYKFDDSDPDSPTCSQCSKYYKYNKPLKRCVFGHRMKENCLNYLYFYENEKHTHRCISCLSSYPSLHREQGCLQLQEDDIIPNCEVYSRDLSSQNEQVVCGRCKKGFSILKKEENSECVFQTKDGLKGCARYTKDPQGSQDDEGEGYRCEQCDGERGYEINKEGRCEKDTRKFTELF